MNTSNGNADFLDYCRSLRVAGGRVSRVLLLQIPQILLDAFNRDVALRRGYYIFPPTGLQCLYEATRHRDLEFRILDLNYEILRHVHEDSDFSHEDWPKILEKTLAEFQPHIVGVSCLFDVGINPMLTALRVIREHTKAVAIGGGVIATYEWKRLLGPGLCHFVVEGEGENKLNVLLDNLTDQNLETPISSGIHFRPDDMLLETAGPPDNIVCKGDMVASYGLVPIEKYFQYGSLNPFSRMKSVEIHPFAAIQLARGCRAACTFCAVRDFMGKGVRARPAADVLGEMEFLIEKRGVRHFEWLDDDLMFYKSEVQSILKGIIAKRWSITWSANNGLIAASLDAETLGLMRDSGCIGFKIGIETGNPEMLRKVRKPAKHEKLLVLSSLLDATPEIFVGGNFIVGLPEETFGQMMDSFRFALLVDLDWAAFTVCQVIRGASAFNESGEYFEEQMKSEGRKIANFIPARQSRDGVVDGAPDELDGMAIFTLSLDTVPSAEQVKEIWFAFNLIVNFVHNKNLRPGGRPEKFIAWVETAQRAYPTNPYMSLFLALAFVLDGDATQAETLRGKTATLLDDLYWQKKFSQYHLDGLMDNFPRQAEDVHAALTELYGKISVDFPQEGKYWLAESQPIRQS
jgi:radical SAM superfamily enzyme YgiQ (UPF0313 family)